MKKSQWRIIVIVITLIVIAGTTWFLLKDKETTVEASGVIENINPIGTNEYVIEFDNGFSGIIQGPIDSLLPGKTITLKCRIIESEVSVDVLPLCQISEDS